MIAAHCDECPDSCSETSRTALQKLRRILPLHAHEPFLSGKRLSGKGGAIQAGTMALSSPKTEAGARRIVIDPDIRAVLEAHRSAQRAELGGAATVYNLVFTSRDGRPLHPRNFDRTGYRLQETAGVPRIRFHDLRHMHVSLLVKSGFDPRTVADRVGHSDASFTLRQYSHMFDEQRSATAVALSDLLDGVRDGTEGT